MNNSVSNLSSVTPNLSINSQSFENKAPSHTDQYTFPDLQFTTPTTQPASIHTHNSHLSCLHKKDLVNWQLNQAAQLHNELENALKLREDLEKTNTKLQLLQENYMTRVDSLTDTNQKQSKEVEALRSQLLGNEAFDYSDHNATKTNPSNNYQNQTPHHDVYFQYPPLMEIPKDDDIGIRDMTIRSLKMQLHEKNIEIKKLKPELKHKTLLLFQKDNQLQQCYDELQEIEKKKHFAIEEINKKSYNEKLKYHEENQKLREVFVNEKRARFNLRKKLDEHIAILAQSQDKYAVLNKNFEILKIQYNEQQHKLKKMFEYNVYPLENEIHEKDNEIVWLRQQLQEKETVKKANDQFHKYQYAQRQQGCTSYEVKDTNVRDQSNYIHMFHESQNEIKKLCKKIKKMSAKLSQQKQQNVEKGKKLDQQVEKLDEQMHQINEYQQSSQNKIDHDQLEKQNEKKNEDDQIRIEKNKTTSKKHCEAEHSQEENLHLKQLFKTSYIINVHVGSILNVIKAQANGLEPDAEYLMLSNPADNYKEDKKNLMDKKYFSNLQKVLDMIELNLKQVRVYLNNIYENFISEQCSMQ